MLRVLFCKDPDFPDRIRNFANPDLDSGKKVRSRSEKTRIRNTAAKIIKISNKLPIIYIKHRHLPDCGYWLLLVGGSCRHIVGHSRRRSLNNWDSPQCCGSGSAWIRSFCLDPDQQCCGAGPFFTSSGYFFHRLRLQLI